MVYCTVFLKRCLSFRLGEKVFAIATVALMFFFSFIVRKAPQRAGTEKRWQLRSPTVPFVEKKVLLKYKMSWCIFTTLRYLLPYF